MAKSRKDMMKLLGKLLAEYAEFQRRRPDLPQGDLRGLSEKEMEILVTEFPRDRATEEDGAGPRPPRNQGAGPVRFGAGGASAAGAPNCGPAQSPRGVEVRLYPARERKFSILRLSVRPRSR
jgi:hypothetical protein